MEAFSFLDHIQSLVEEDLARVEVLLWARPGGQHEAVCWAVEHLVSGGGKRLRPTLLMLSSHLCGADIDRAVFAAAAVEMLHTATLVHDDLALVRRGRETLNAQPQPWSSGTTVLTGDYVFAYAAYLASLTENVRLMQRFSETLMTVCNGEMRQIFDGRGYHPEIEDATDHLQSAAAQAKYERRIYAKTASLLEISAETGAILSGSSELAEALRTYGRELGMAFQIVDDVLDFVAEEETLRKPTGSDLRQGLVTLPTLLFLETRPENSVIAQVLRGDDSEPTVQEAMRIVVDSPAIERATAVARRHVERAKRALDGLPAGVGYVRSPYRGALLDLADFTVRRRF